MLSHKTEPFRIAIIGGGVGGLSLAIGLSKYPHISITIYEANTEFSDTGTEVSFGTNSHLATQLIDPAIWKEYESHAAFEGWESDTDTCFEFLYGEKGEQEGKRIIEAHLQNNMKQTNLNRAHFLQELTKLVPEGCVRFGKRCMGIEQSKQKVVMKFEDDTTDEADAVIACDGISSVCRSVLFGSDSELVRPQFTGKVAYRGLIPSEKLHELVGEERARRTQIYLGHGRHVLTFPVARGHEIGVAAFASYKENGGESDGEWVKPNQKEEMEKAYQGFGKSVKQILALVPNPDIYALYDHPLAPTYHRGLICLLGDSAHACTPHLGANASMALEDAYVLSNLLGLCTSKSAIPYAFRAYDTVRIPRTQNVIRESREQGKILDLEGEGVGDDLECLKQKLDASVRAIWNMDLKAHMEEAVAAFRKEKVRADLERMGIGSYIKNKRDAMSW